MNFFVMRRKDGTIFSWRSFEWEVVSVRRGLILAIVSMVVLAFSVIKIGVVFPMTGNLSAVGEAAWNGIQIAHEEKPTVLGQEVKLILVDNRSEKAEAANAFSRLISKEKVIAIIGAMSSGNTLAGVPIAEENGIPTISPWATNPLVTQNRKFINRACFIDPFQGAAAAVFAYKELGSRRVAIFMDVEQDYCVGLANFFYDKFTRLGGVAFKLFYRTGDQDFAAQIASAMQLGVDTIYIPGYYTEAALIARQARQMGFTGKLLAGDGVEFPELVKIGGEAVEGMYFTTHYHPKGAATEVSKIFVKKYREKYGEDPSAAAALAYDAYMMMLKAIEMAGEPDPVKIAQNIRKIKDFPGVTGYITIDANGNAIKPVVVDVVKNGKFEFVKMIYPKDIQ